MAVLASPALIGISKLCVFSRLILFEMNPACVPQPVAPVNPSADGAGRNVRALFAVGSLYCGDGWALPTLP